MIPVVNSRPKLMLSEAYSVCYIIKKEEIREKKTSVNIFGDAIRKTKTLEQIWQDLDIHKDVTEQ